MTPLETVIGLFVAIVLLTVAVYYGRRQQATLQQLRTGAALAKEERRYLLKRSWRRLFGSLLLVILAVMLVGALFLNYDPPPENADPEVYRQSSRFLLAYVLAMLLIVMAMLVVAVFDFWATARFGVEQRKQLIQEHQELLSAELSRYRNRRADMN